MVNKRAADAHRLRKRLEADSARADNEHEYAKGNMRSIYLERADKKWFVVEALPNASIALSSN